MTLSKASTFSMDKRNSISKTFSWLPTPMNHHAKENRRRSAAPTISTTPTSTTPSLSSSSSSSFGSPTTKKFGFFSKFRSSVTELDQILSSDEDEEDHQTPPTPRDSQHLIPPTSISSHSSITKTTSPPSLVTMTPAAYMQHDISSRSSLSPPPKPPQHASLNQHVQNILASTFDSVDEMIEKEWESDRHRLEIDLLTPAPYQFS